MELVLPSGHVALLDAEDWPQVAGYNWYAQPSDRTVYVFTVVRLDGCQVTRMLHRVIMAAPSEVQVDHKDHNGLNNRRSNLRLATQSQNMGNSRIGVRNKSGYKGVCWNKFAKKWRAEINISGKRTYLGYFNDPWEAAQAYNVVALTIWGEFALLNRRLP